MIKKTVLASFLVVTLMLSLTALDACAFGGEKAKGYHKSHGGHEGLEEKFFRKAYRILKNQDELGLSDRQIEKIKDLKIEIKKDLIRKNAEIDIIALDIKAAMWKERINTESINRLIDKKYELKKEKTKSLIEAYAAVKESLTDKQKDKLKDIRKKCKEQMMKYCTMSDKR